MFNLLSLDFPSQLVEAVKIARRSTIKHHKTGALIIRDGEFIKGWSHVAQWNNGLHSVHAEMAALAKANLRHAYNQPEVYVACLTAAKKIGNGKPCLSCAIALRAAGVKKVTYTLPYNEFDVLLLTEELVGLKEYKRCPTKN